MNQGGSLQMWRDYFGRKAAIHGVDIDPRCEKFGAGTRVHIGDQEDRDFLRSLADEVGPIDVVIEDGGHTMGQQIATFEEIYPRMAPDGVFLDRGHAHELLGRLRRRLPAHGNLHRVRQGRIDQLNAWHSRDPAFEVDDFTRSTKSMHFYDSIVVFERGEVVKPHHEMTGRTLYRRRGDDPNIAARKASVEDQS